MTKDAKLFRLINSLATHLINQISLHSHLVEAYSFAEAIMYRSYQSGFVVNDYLHFCYTKSARSLAATKILIEDGFREDAFVLLRGIYENYIHFQYVRNNPDQINDFVSAKIGLSRRRYVHAKTKRGGKNPAAVVNLETGAQLRYGRGLSEMIRSIGQPVTPDLHELIYEYLSEHAHNHFMALGNYLSDTDPARFEVFPHGVNLEVAIYALLMSSFWLQNYPSFEDIDESDDKNIRSELRKSKAILRKALNALEAEGKYIDMREGLLAMTAFL